MVVILHHHVDQFICHLEKLSHDIKHDFTYSWVSSLLSGIIIIHSYCTIFLPSSTMRLCTLRAKLTPVHCKFNGHHFSTFIAASSSKNTLTIGVGAAPTGPVLAGSLFLTSS